MKTHAQSSLFQSGTRRYAQQNTPSTRRNAFTTNSDWPGPPVVPPEVNDMEVDELRREAAPENQKEGNTARTEISSGNRPRTDTLGV